MASIRRVSYTREIPADAVRTTHRGKPAVRFPGPDGKPITAPLTANGRRCRVLSTKWYGQYSDASGKPRREPLSANKDAARMMLNDILKRVEMEKSGHKDPCAGHRRTPLRTHLADWLAVLSARGRDAEYVALKKARVGAILDGCGFVFPADLSAERLERFLESLRTGVKRLSIQTTNDYLQAVSQMCTWMVENDRLERNPFASVKKLNAERDRRHIRRVPYVGELQGLIATARASGRPIRNMSGPDRAMLYAVAALTGYRAGVLAELAPECFCLDTNPATIDLDGRFTKNGKPASQPIPSALAAELRTFLAGRRAGSPVWPGMWRDRPSLLIYTDAAAAGIPLTVDTKDGPEELDFHSLRATYATMLDGLDISMKERQVLMRHSDPRLTLNRYTRARLHDLGAAAERLPSLTAGTGPDRERIALRATGTDGTGADRPRSACPPLALPLALRTGDDRGAVGAGEEEPGSDDPAPETNKPLGSQGFEDGREAVRTTGAERAGFSDRRPVSHLDEQQLPK